MKLAAHPLTTPAARATPFLGRLAKFSGPARVILEGLKSHGMILADNGGDWFISGAPHDRWVHEELRAIRAVKGRDLEVVKMRGLVAG